MGDTVNLLEVFHRLDGLVVPVKEEDVKVANKLANNILPVFKISSVNLSSNSSMETNTPSTEWGEKISTYVVLVAVDHSSLKSKNQNDGQSITKKR
jgi:hypothetical protein